MEGSQLYHRNYEIRCRPLSATALSVSIATRKAVKGEGWDEIRGSHTINEDSNPHDSHHGEQDCNLCTTCMASPKPSVLYECHFFGDGMMNWTKAGQPNLRRI